jgi:hypothetical protein
MSTRRASWYASRASGLAPGAIERKHQLRTEALAQRLRLDELLELPDQLAGGSELQVRVDPLLDGAETRFLEPADLVAGERLEPKILERRPAPEGQCGSQLLCALARLSPVRLCGEPLEASEVEPLWIDSQHVSRRLRDEHLRSDRLAKARDVVLQGSGGRLCRFRAQTSSIRRSLETSSFACSRRYASSARIRRRSSAITRPSSTTVSGPRTRNSTGIWRL